MAYYERWAPYVPVAQRRAQAAREAKALAGKGQKLRPIHSPGCNIADSFWGKAWCQNLENYSDWANRMPRGRTYARNGSIIDLKIVAGEITSLVSGSQMYKIRIKVEKIKPITWKAIRRDCAAKVGSLIDLMRGKLPEAVLKRLTSPKDGMFPSPKEIKIQCSCPDWAVMCKHAAATLYGVGHLLDSEPELFFLMRGVSQTDLVADALQTQQQSDSMGLDARSSLENDDLGALFGIDLASSEGPAENTDSKRKRKTPAGSTTKKRPAKKTDDSLRKTQAKSKPATKKAATKNVIQKKGLKKPTAFTNAKVKVKTSVKKPSVPNPQVVKKAVVKKTLIKKAAIKKKGAKKVAEKTTETKKTVVRKADSKQITVKKTARKKAVRK